MSTKFGSMKGLLLVLSMLTFVSITMLGAENKVQLKGKVMMTFDDDHYVVQTDRYYYRIGKATLNPAINGSLESAAVGGKTISIKVSSTDIQYVWPVVAAKQANNTKSNKEIRRQVASTDAPDFFSAQGGFLQIRGTLHYTPGAQSVFVQSNRIVFQFKKSEVSISDPSLLETNGAQVEMTVPLTAIEYYWKN